TVANDTICLLLSGLMHYSQEELIGGIVGTGVNFALFDHGQAINIEAGNFDIFTPSQEATILDQMSQRPGEALFEKEVSGAYLFQHYNVQIRGNSNVQPLISTMELAKLSIGSDESAQRAKKILEYSASLVACQIAGILEFKKRSCVGVMEGSLFWKAHNYKTLVETYVSMLTSYSIKFEKVDDDSIVGGAMLVS
ncbi:MAG TPA: hypothetical protein PLD54_02570, partial [Candidatus Levybacteria bacterium]|nr:hypothetical protein [Candidatus Levybacteria bacterium]